MFDVSILDGHHKWRSRCLGSRHFVGINELRVIIRNQHAQEEHTEAVEEQDPVESELDGARNGLARILRLPDRDTDEFRAEISKDGIDEGAPEPEESSATSSGNVLLESSRVIIVLEPSGIIWPSANREEEAQENESDLMRQ